MAKMEKEKDKEECLQFLDDKIEKALLDSRRVFISDAIDNKTARDTIRKLWYLEITQPGKPITIIINSPGGSVDCGMAIWDQVKMLSSPIFTLVTGLAASMGSVLSLVASKGKRFATPYSRIMIHQPSISGPLMGQATDLDIQAKEILRTKTLLVDLYMSHTGLDRDTIEKAIDRDKWMDAQEAKKFGLLDKIVTSFSELK